MKETIKFKGIEYEECSGEEAYNKETNYLKKGYFGIYSYSDSDVKEIFFKPVQKFPIVFEGENMNFEIRLDTDKIPYLFIHSQRYSNLEEKDIEANQKALDKLKELIK